MFRLATVNTKKKWTVKYYSMEKKRKKKNYLWDQLVTSTLSTFVKEVIYSCTVQMIRVLNIVQVRDLLGYKGLPYFCL